MMNKIPKGWEKYYLSDCFNTISIKNKIKTKDYLPQGKFPIIDQGQDFISGYSNDENLLINVKKPIVIFGDHTRCFKFINFDFIAGADGIKILEPKDNFNEKLFYYFCQILDFPNKGYSRHFQYLKKAIINFPKNLSEQKAIADKLDDSFAKIENAITNLINAKENLKLYKQSVLKSAFNGDLLPNTSPTHWEVKKLGEICEIMDNQRKPINSSEREKRLISAKQKFPYYGATGQVGFIDDYIFDCEAVLLGEDGAPFLDFFKDKAYMVSGKFWVNNHAHILKAKNKISLNAFICYFLNTLDYSPYVSGTTRLKLNQSSMKNIEIPLPSLSEQNLIVAEIDKRFEVVDKTLNLIDKSIQNAKNLKQSILKKAFSGELRSDI